MNPKAVLEGLLFVSGDDGLTLEQARNLLEIEGEELARVVADLMQEYDSENRGIKLEILGNRLKLTTKKEHKEYYQKLLEDETSEFLSQAALETLAIIAYNGPLVRSQVEEIRGVDSSHMVRKLLLKNLIEEKGRTELPGRPILYGVTDDFLDYFGLRSIEDLPKIEEKEMVEEETNLFESRYQEKKEEE